MGVVFDHCFFFQAEDGIRDYKVTGVQTCALPISLLTQAARDGASDIHIEPYERHSSVRFRVDGDLREVVQPNRALHAALISRLKIMADLDIAEKDRKSTRLNSSHLVISYAVFCLK